MVNGPFAEVGDKEDLAGGVHKSHSCAQELPRQARSDILHPGGLLSKGAGSRGELGNDSRTGKPES